MKAVKYHDVNSSVFIIYKYRVFELQVANVSIRVNTLGVHVTYHFDIRGTIIQTDTGRNTYTRDAHEVWASPEDILTRFKHVINQWPSSEALKIKK